jgi:outer membrane receptor for ferrienterochelin and colicin
VLVNRFANRILIVTPFPKNTMLILAAVLFSTWTTITAVFAQEVAEETIDEIQVTATRRPLAESDVSAALTSISVENIRGTKIITDALAAQPGVFLQQTTPGQGAAIIRGLKGSEVLHLVDGMRLNNAIFRNAPTQYLALVAPGTVDRIEVVRGAPASLYGSDAVGGVVQVLSRIPSFDEPGTRGDAYLAYDTADLGKVIRGSFDIGNERLAGLISGEYLQTGNRRIGGGQRVAPTGYESKGARIALSATPDDEQSWLFDFQYASQPATPRIDELVPGFGQTEPSSSEFLFSPNDRLFAHIKHTRANWLWSADWSFDAGWQRIDDDRISRDFQSQFRRREKNSSDLFGVTASAAGDTRSGSWIVGAELYHDRVRSQRSEEDIVSGQVQELQARFPDDASADQAAVYANLLHSLSGRHTLSGGLRFSAIGVDLPQTTLSPAASVDQNDISADIGWIFDMDQQSQIVANLGYGFRAPNVFDLGTLGDRPGNRFNIPNPDLESERIYQFDVGFRHHDELWDLNVMLFALHYTDRITSVFTGAVTPSGRDVVQSRNVESADILGVEAAAHFILSAATTTGLIVNYIRGEQTEAGSVAVSADRIPPFNGRLSLRYAASESLSVEPYLLFAGSQDRLSPRDIRDVRINPDGTPGWLTANVAVTWQPNERWQFVASLENVFDKQYRLHGSGIDSTGTNLILSLHTLW